MQKIKLYLTGTAYLIMMALCQSCHQEKNELAHDHSHEHHQEAHESPDVHEGHEGHNHGGGNEIVLEPALADKMGVKTTVVTPGDFFNSIHTTAKISASSSSSGIVSAKTAGIFTFVKGITMGSEVKKGQKIGSVNATQVSGGDTNAAALSALNSAKRELDRLTPLYEKQLVTAEKYNAALTAYEQAKTAYSPAAASGVVTSPLTGTITQILVSEGQYVEQGAELATITDGASLTLTADVPEKYGSSASDITSAIILGKEGSQYIDIKDIGGRKITSSNVIGSNPGYFPVVFTLDNTRNLIPGSVVEVDLLCNKSDNVISVPIEAITEQQGSYFVFVKVDEEGYLKSPVKLGRRNGRLVEILSGVHEGDEIVTENVSALRLAETSGAVPEGHTHSH